MTLQKRLMHSFSASPWFQEWVGGWGYQHHFWAYGLPFSARTLLVSTLPLESQRIIICQDRETLEKWREDLLTWLPEERVLEYPPTDWFRFSTLAKGLESEMKRMHVLSDLLERKRGHIILATAESLIEPVMGPLEMERQQQILQEGLDLPMQPFLEWLVESGYERIDQVEEKGQFAVRGGIVDLFAPDQEMPIRIEWFGDEIDTLRSFSSETQRTIERISEISILPLHPNREKNALTASIFEYLKETDWLVMDDPLRCREVIQEYRAVNQEFAKKMLDWKTVLQKSEGVYSLYFSLLLRRVPGLDLVVPMHVDARSLPQYQQQFDVFLEDLEKWQNQNRRMLILMSSKEKGEHLRRQLNHEGVNATPNLDEWDGKSILITEGWVEEGFELPQNQLVVIPERQLLGKGKKPRRRSEVKKKAGIQHFRDIHAGDYVVHSIHGIGRYIGVETVEVDGVHKDYLLIRYAGEDKLFIPTEQVGSLQKYIGNDGEHPRIHKLGGNEWSRIKAKAKASAQDIAKELIEIYAKRKSTPGFAFEKDTPWQAEFEETFPYEETDDQLHAIEDVKKDMEKPYPMDRLICGDVGFGKTEIAIRAAFKAVMGGKQVAILVPTTVLAFQHYQTFSNRFAGFGPTVELITRYRSVAERKKILQGVSEGQIDVLIGTHSILQKGIQFKNLGLLVVDEEQRFGVTQKEKWKSLQPDVDILSLSATPIPRTLHMSLTGLRDMSIVDTPPEERRPVQTYVAEKKSDIIQEAIERELRRGGQVYVIYNRIQGLEKFANEIKELLPHAEIAVAHGRLSENRLEDVIKGFYEGEYDVLVSTSIVENGLDIPNANTILVYDADKLGLSQLYQMRGRVGRSKRQAYAYFFYEPDKILTEVAEKRLQTLLEYTELGAGFKIAMRDLEIRGAGNLLGAQQHGQIANVGFEMYCQLIEEAVQELSPEGDLERTDPVPKAEAVIDLSINAYVPNDYIDEPLHKMEVYQTLANVSSKESLEDFLDELIDRFGDPPKEVLNLIKVAELRVKATAGGVKMISSRFGNIEVLYGKEAQVAPGKWIEWHKKYSQMLQLIQRKEETLIRIKEEMIPTEKLDFLIQMLEELQEVD